MMYEFLKGPASKWRPYFDVLPDTFDSLMFWSDAELAELQASHVVNNIGKAEADQSFRSVILPLVREHPTIFPFPKTSASGGVDDETVLELAHRMASTIMAYSFDAADEPGDEGDDSSKSRPTKTMVPLADMLNADLEKRNVSMTSTALN